MSVGTNVYTSYYIYLKLTENEKKKITELTKEQIVKIYWYRYSPNSWWGGESNGVVEFSIKPNTDFVKYGEDDYRLAVKFDPGFKLFHEDYIGLGASLKNAKENIQLTDQTVYGSALTFGEGTIYES
jgi:hypothetical protein